MNQNMKSLSIAALVMVGMLACVKETPQETKPVETPGVTVTLSTTVNLQENTKALTAGGVKTFAKNEQIAVVYKNTSGNTVKATSVALTDGDITNEGRSAQFTVTLTDPDRSQNVTYIYPAAMAKDNGEPNWEALASQNGTLATLASQLDYAKYTGAWTAGALPTGTLDNQLAILALTLKSSDGASVITDEISRLTLFTGAHSYVVTRTPAEGPIYIAIHPTDNADIQLVAQSATRFYTKSLTDKTYAASNGYPLSFRMAALPEGALPGKFAIANGTEVYFSRGNLQAVFASAGSSCTWQFAANQWDYIGINTANTANNKINGNGSVSAAGTVDLFGWSTAATTYGIHNSTINDTYSGTFKDWGENAITNGGNRINSGWRTLESTEWAYLWNSRGNAANLRTLATVNNVTGLILMPDGWTASGVALTVTTANYTTNNINSTDWNTLEQQGCVFLPAGGYRHGTEIIYAGSYGAYWSSTSTSSDKATSMDFSSSTVVAYNTNRSTGCSVRLVYNAN